MADNDSSNMRIPSWFSSATRCRDCSVLVSKGDRCDYCAEHPYEMKGVCASCDGKIYDQHEMRFKLFGNYCFTCDLNAEKKNSFIPLHPALF